MCCSWFVCVPTSQLELHTEKNSTCIQVKQRCMPQQQVFKTQQHHCECMAATHRGNSSSGSSSISTDSSYTKLYDCTPQTTETTHLHSGILFSQSFRPPSAPAKHVQDATTTLYHRQWAMAACIVVLTYTAFILGHVFIKADSRWQGLAPQKSLYNSMYDGTQQLHVLAVDAALVEDVDALESKQRPDSQNLEVGDLQRKGGLHRRERLQTKEEPVEQGHPTEQGQPVEQERPVEQEQFMEEGESAEQGLLAQESDENKNQSNLQDLEEKGGSEEEEQSVYTTVGAASV